MNSDINQHSSRARDPFTRARAMFWATAPNRIPLLTCSGVDEDALVGPQVPEVKQHHVGGDVVDREGGSLLETHALRDEEGVVCGRHHHLLPQPEAVQHHHLIADLEQRMEGRREL